MRLVVLALKGMAYGITDVAPGLGGGIVLILMGVYEEFVEATGNLLVQRSRWRKHLGFLIPLGIGALLGVVLAAIAIDALLEAYPTESMLFFMGLLLGRALLSPGLGAAAGIMACGPSPRRAESAWGLALCLLAGGAVALLLGRSAQEAAPEQAHGPSH